MSTGILDRQVQAQRAEQAQGHRPGRPELRLVPTGADAVRAARDSRPRMRLTRFGRLVVSMIVAACLVLLATGLVGSLASATGEVEQITVRAGQTLSGIAVQHLPELSVRDAVVELQIFNSLSTDQIHAGQTLRIPSP